MKIMALLAPLVANPVTIAAVVLTLMVWALWSGIELWRGTWRLVRCLDAARARIEATPDAAGFAADYETIAAALAADRVLGSRWTEFATTLLPPPIPNRPVRTSRRPDEWFDLGLLRAQEIAVDARYHAAMPNLLVGAGLLFTFLGLAAALSSAGGIVAEGATQASRNAALQHLLDAASFKFVTSVVGLALSIVYALVRKRRMRAVEHALDRFLEALDARMPLLTPVAAQQEATTLLAGLNDKIDVFTNQLAVAIGDALDTAFDKRLGEHIGPLTTAMQTLAESLRGRSEDTMKAMLDEFMRRLEGSSGERMAQVVESLAKLATRLDELQSGLTQAARQMATAAEEMAARMGQGADAALSRITENMSGLAGTLQRLVDQTRTAGTDAARELGGTLEKAGQSAADKLVAAAEDAGARLGREAAALAAASTALATRIGELQHATGEAARPLAAAGSDLRAMTEAATAALRPLHDVATQLAEAAHRIGAAQTASAELAARLDAAGRRFEGVDQSLGSVLEKMQANLVHMIEQISTFVRTIDGDLAKAANQIAAMVRSLEMAGAD